MRSYHVIKKEIIFVLLFIFSCLRCSLFTSPDDKEIIQTQNPIIAAVGLFTENGIIRNKLILFDYYNPKYYKIINDTTYWPVCPVVSHNNRKIIFCDPKHAALDYGDLIVIYDIYSNTFKTYGDSEPCMLYGIALLWNPDDTGFYFTFYPAWGFQHVLFFDIATRTVKTISQANFTRVFPVDVIDADTIIVSFYDSLMKSQPPGLYFMDSQGNYISRINNPHLYYSRSFGLWIPKVDWNKDLKLLVYNEYYTASSGMGVTKISVTNLDGSYYKNLTTEEYYDSHPIWSPDGKSILFQRCGAGLNPEEWYNSKIMKIDYRTGTVTEFINQNMIPNCIGLSFWGF